MRYLYAAKEYLSYRKAWVVYDVALYVFALYGLYRAIYPY